MSSEVCGAEGLNKSGNRDSLLKSMNEEQREKFLAEEAEEKAHQDLKTRHVLKTTGLFRGGGNPLKSGGGRGGRGGGGGAATSRSRSATVSSGMPTPPIFTPVPISEPVEISTEAPTVPPPSVPPETSPSAVAPATSGGLMSSVFEPVLEDSPLGDSSTQKSPPPLPPPPSQTQPSQSAAQPNPEHTRNNNVGVKVDAQAEMMAGMNPEQKEAYLLEIAKAKEHEDSRTRHVLKTTGLFRAPGGNPLKAGGRGGGAGRGRRTSSFT